MTRSTPFWKQRQMWTVAVGLVALAFWVVGVGAGWRGWVLTPWDQGIVAHAQGFGEKAYIWWIPATIISLTTVMMAIGISVVRHLVGQPVEAVPEQEPLEPLEPLEALELPESAPEPEIRSASGTGVEDADTAEDVDATEASTEDDGPDDGPGTGVEDADTGEDVDATEAPTEDDGPDAGPGSQPGTDRSL